VAEAKDDDFETNVAGTTWDADGIRLLACAAERGAFMAPFGFAAGSVTRTATIPDVGIFKKVTFNTRPSRPQLFDSPVRRKKS